MADLPPAPERPQAPADRPSDGRWAIVAVIALLGFARAGIGEDAASIGTRLGGATGGLVFLVLIALVVWLATGRRSFRDAYLSWWTLGIGGGLMLLTTVSKAGQEAQESG